MPKASVTRNIGREKQKLINFVLDIEKYPEFIPFCIDSKVYERNDHKDEIAIIADLTIGKKPFVDTYKSDVRYNKQDDTIHVTNIGGPLKHLENNWKFIQKDKFTEVHFGELFMGLYFAAKSMLQKFKVFRRCVLSSI